MPAKLQIPPEVQPAGGWRLLVMETGGAIEGQTFDVFCRTINGHLLANGHGRLTCEEILRRVHAASQD